MNEIDQIPDWILKKIPKCKINMYDKTPKQIPQDTKGKIYFEKQTKVK